MVVERAAGVEEAGELEEPAAGVHEDNVSEWEDLAGAGSAPVDGGEGRHARGGREAPTRARCASVQNESQCDLKERATGRTIKENIVNVGLPLRIWSMSYRMKCVLYVKRTC